MNAILTLARLTFREAIRRRIMLAGLILGLGFIIFFSIGFHYILVQLRALSVGVATGSPIADIADTRAINGFLLIGLYAVTFLAVAMAALLAADTLAGEISSGTLQTIVTRPIRRADVVLGKWLGFAGLLELYVSFMAGGVVLSVYLQSGYVPQYWAAGVSLIFLEALLIMTIALLCSSAFPALATGGIVFGLYGLALIGGWVEEIGAAIQNVTAVRVGIFSSLIMPSEALWKRVVYELQSPLTGVLGPSPFGARSTPSQWMVAYALTYVLACLTLAIRTFQRRDL
jgi:ABC-type transport system involved in multi-copper enzyme maturation permease subunit